MKLCPLTAYKIIANIHHSIPSMKKNLGTFLSLIFLGTNPQVPGTRLVPYFKKKIVVHMYWKLAFWLEEGGEYGYGGVHYGIP
jgi:hypothetical protein